MPGGLRCGLPYGAPLCSPPESNFGNSPQERRFPEATFRCYTPVMFHHLRRLWRPEGRSKPLPSRHCCGNDSSGPPSFGGVPRGSRPAPAAQDHPSSTCVFACLLAQSIKTTSTLWRGPLNPGGLAYRQTGRGFAPHRAIPPPVALLRACGGLLDGSPQQVATCTAGFAPIDLFSTRFAQRGKKSTGPPAGRALHRGPLVERAPHPKCSPPALRFATASRGGAGGGGSPAQAPACALRGLFQASALCLIS